MRPRGQRAAARVLALMFVGLVPAACGDDDGGTQPFPPPGAPTVTASTVADTVFVSWTRADGAITYGVTLTSGSARLKKSTSGLEVTFTAADGLEDGVVYTVEVFAGNSEGETPATNKPTVETNFFPWDEYFATSLHATGQGKKTFYNVSPNGGFEHYTGIAYETLACKGCHEPASTGGCLACHDTENPQLGAQVDATAEGVCGNCHGRQKAEVGKGYGDVHRDAGMGCMDCHTLGDVHGDGTQYASMLEDGAIDAKCSNCHNSVSSNSYHDMHSSTVDCTACHTQSVVTCYNCHFETEVELHTKKAYTQVKDWLFLINRNGKVHTANFQSVTHDGDAMVGMGPFYAHTVSRNARTGCSDCHGNESVTDWFDDDVIDVVVWDGAAGALTFRKGVIPVPPNYASGGMRFDFVDLDQPGGSVWSFLKTGADRIQLLYGTPLTAEQMNKLR